MALKKANTLGFIEQVYPLWGRSIARWPSRRIRGALCSMWALILWLHICQYSLYLTGRLLSPPPNPLPVSTSTFRAGFFCPKRLTNDFTFIRWWQRPPCKVPAAHQEVNSGFSILLKNAWTHSKGGARIWTSNLPISKRPALSFPFFPLSKGRKEWFCCSCCPPEWDKVNLRWGWEWFLILRSTDCLFKYCRLSPSTGPRLELVQ